MASIPDITDVDLSNLDPRICEAIEQLYSEHRPPPTEPASENGDMEEDEPDENTCPICWRPLLFPIQFGPCSHIFCAECLWRQLFHCDVDAGIDSVPFCPSCRSSSCNFS